ncbi:Y-family DNA polymerase [Oceanivirga miroungae]|uniref:DNA polymerase IV n=1 Tax=Oceanivirga miroungae TaxID=1130046 RepID=A0A6I8M7T6_9FUSO|nr:DNA methylase [Oceanivirga miroungae]VWL85467.1 DNA polymerase IV [Oceanivirga miroungae]
MNDRCYLAIDLKSFFASVECVERNLDPLTANLVVANEEKTDKTICLAITPNLKSYGISSRPRLYEVKSKIEMLNKTRKDKIDFIIAKPRMKKYIEYSSKIYQIYLDYVSKDDIHVYSIDEVFIDITSYLKLYNMKAYDFAKLLLEKIYEKTNITATAGIGTNLYLAKVAMDILAKKMKADENNLRIATLTELKYKKLLWDHKSLTDFWRVGKAYAKTLEANNMHTMGDIAIKSIEDENLLYKLFGVAAELLIDHAWGVETCSIKEIKRYKSKTHSLQRAQVLDRPYTNQELLLIIKEMVDNITLELVEKNLLTNKVILDIGYDVENLQKEYFVKETIIDMYGRELPKNTKITLKLDNYTNSEKKIKQELIRLYEKESNKIFSVRRLSITVANIINSFELGEKNYTQLDIFNLGNKLIEEEKYEKKELDIRNAVVKVKKKYGKNAILKLNNLEKNSTAIKRNESIGGHNE